MLRAHSQELGKLALQGTGEVRLLAIAAIRQSRDLNRAPLLIRLLEDPDPRIAQAADAALGHLSRRFDKPDSTIGREQLVKKWKLWFQGIRPEIDLETVDLLGAG